MKRNPREKVPQAKQDGGVDRGKACGATASSRTWTGLNDPRIVRVARSLGGKDRHSKVNTIRGLRDRRVRLSVPTAIQLYDLQDRLGVSQPSKVVDWLLDAARHEIDKLPPLQIPPGSFFQCPESMTASNGASLPEEEAPSGSPMVASMEWRAKRRCSTSAGEVEEEKDGLFRRIEQDQRVAEVHGSGIPVHGDLRGQGHASMLSIPSSSCEHHSSYHMEASTQLCVPHLGCYQLSQGEELQGYRPTTSPLSMFSPYASAAAASGGYDHRHANGFQIGSSASQGFTLSYLPGSLHGASAGINMRPLHVSISSRHQNCQHNHDNSTDC